MRVHLTAVVLVLLTGSSARAATVEADWDPVTKDLDGHPETISHYILYSGLKPRPAEVLSPGNDDFEYDDSQNVGGETTARQADLEPSRTYFFAVTAVDIDGNISNYSKEAHITIPAVGEGLTKPVVEKTAKEPEGGCAAAGRGPLKPGLVAFLALLLVVFRQRLGRLQ